MCLSRVDVTGQYSRSLQYHISEHKRDVFKYNEKSALTLRVTNTSQKIFELKFAFKLPVEILAIACIVESGKYILHSRKEKVSSMSIMSNVFSLRIFTFHLLTLHLVLLHANQLEQINLYLRYRL